MSELLVEQGDVISFRWDGHKDRIIGLMMDRGGAGGRRICALSGKMMGQLLLADYCEDAKLVMEKKDVAAHFLKMIKKPRRKRAAPLERRKAVRTVHVVDDDSSPRDLALARNDLVDFLTKRY